MFIAENLLGVFPQVSPFLFSVFSRSSMPRHISRRSVVFLQTFTTSYEHDIAHNRHSWKFGDICHIINSIRTIPHTTVPVTGLKQSKNTVDLRSGTCIVIWDQSFYWGFREAIFRGGGRVVGKLYSQHRFTSQVLPTILLIYVSLLVLK